VYRFSRTASTSSTPTATCSVNPSVASSLTPAVVRPCSQTSPSGWLSALPALQDRPS
jgi:hypothetical protein